MIRARAYLGVGSNLLPEKHVEALLELLRREPEVLLTGISTFYWTPPLPGPGASSEDPHFLNGVLEVETALGQDDLLEILHRLEAALGRRRAQGGFGPRTMDVDLLLFLPPDGPPSRVDSDVLNRAFVALPLLELAPELHLPPEDVPLATVAARFRDPGGPPAPDFTRRIRARFLLRR